MIFVQVCDFSDMCSTLPPTTIVQMLDKALDSILRLYQVKSEVFQELDRLSDLLKVHKAH